MQPMAHHVDRKENRLWFLTTRDTDLARDGLLRHEINTLLSTGDTHD
jgi:general stress protein 26